MTIYRRNEETNHNALHYWGFHHIYIYIYMINAKDTHSRVKRHRLVVLSHNNMATNLNAQWKVCSFPCYSFATVRGHTCRLFRQYLCEATVVLAKSCSPNDFRETASNISQCLLWLCKMYRFTVPAYSYRGYHGDLTVTFMPGALPAVPPSPGWDQHWIVICCPVVREMVQWVGIQPDFPCGNKSLYTIEPPPHPQT